MTDAAEAQAKAGHDALTFYNWDVHNYADALEPIDEVMTRLVAAHGAVTQTCAHLAKVRNQWAAVPTSRGTQTKPPCRQISWFGKQHLDRRAMYPAYPRKTALQDGWTWDAFLKYAEAAKKDGFPFALGMARNNNTDAVNMHGALFKAFSATLIDSEGPSSWSPTRYTKCWCLFSDW